MSNQEMQKIREETYQRKLKENIQQKKRFLETGTLNYEPVQESEEDVTVEELKKRSILLYNSLKTVPFKPQRDDVVNILLAESSVSQQADSLLLFKESLGKSIEQRADELKYLKALNFNLNLVNNLLISKEKETSNVVRSRVQDDAEALLEVMTKRETKLIQYIKQIIFTYVQVGPVGTTDDIDGHKVEVLKLVEDLLNNLSIDPERYIRTPTKLVNDQVLRQLMLGNVIVQKDNFRYIKLNLFGI